MSIDSKAPAPDLGQSHQTAIHPPGFHQKGNQSGSESEHVLVCLSAASTNAKVVHAAAKMAAALRCPFTALLVETFEFSQLRGKDKTALERNVKLAEQLGARVTTVYGDDIPAQIAEYARASRITKVVLGHSAPAGKWRRKSGMVDRLAAYAPDIDLYIIPDAASAPRKNAFRPARPPKLTLANILTSAAALAGCTLLGLGLVRTGFREANVMTLYMLGALVSSLFSPGWLHSLVYSAASVLLYNFFFTVPRLSFDYQSAGGPVTFLVMFVSALLISALGERAQAQARQAAMRAHRTEVMLETGHQLQLAESETEVLEGTARQIVKLLGKPVAIYRVSQGELLEPVLFESEGAEDGLCLSREEREAARWAYENDQWAGAATNTLPAAKCLYLPMRSGNQVAAVAGIAVDRASPPGPFEKSLLMAMLGECGFALEKERLSQAHKQAEVQMEQERLRANLLRMISHDLRTPLTGISGNAEILLNRGGALSREQKEELYVNIHEDAVWLNGLVDNLLSIARMEDKGVQLNMEPELLEDVVDEALRRVTRGGANHHLSAALSHDLLMARMDSRLIIQVIVNLVNNAVKYTPPGSHITVSAKKEGAKVLVEVADDGPGIPEPAKGKIFDRFYIPEGGRGDGRRGLGLGLYLCKAIVEAHGGAIAVKDNVPKGAVFAFDLDAEEAADHE